MAAVVDLHRAAGFRVVGLAPSARAARVLGAETGLPAMTLARYLRGGCRGLDDRTLIVLDEAGMVGSPDWARLVDAVESRGATLRAVGDPRQLSAPKQPAGLFDVLVRTLPEATAQLGEVLRFAEPWEREASVALRDARTLEDADRAISAYEEHGRIYYADDPERAAEAAFAAWHADVLAGRDSVLLAPSWATVRDLNARARLVARAEGRLTGPDVTIGEHAWAVGDLLVTRLNDYTLRDDNVFRC